MPQAVEALRRHKEKQKKQRADAGARWQDLDLIFPNRTGGPLHAANLIRRHFFPLLEAASLPRIRFHDLRHSAATLYLAADTHPKVVQEMLGHSSISLTLDTYSHTVANMQPQAVEAMSQRLRTLEDLAAKQIAADLAKKKAAEEAKTKAAEGGE